DAPASHPSDLAGSVVNSHAPSASFRRGARGPHDPALDASHSYARERAHDASLLRRLVRQHPHLLFGHASLGARRAEEKLAKKREHLDTLPIWRASAMPELQGDPHHRSGDQQAGDFGKEATPS